MTIGARVKTDIPGGCGIEESGVAFQQAHKYERGISRVTVGRLYYIAAALRAPVGYFFAEDEATAASADTQGENVSR